MTSGYRELAQLYKLLSHPVRLRILEMLSNCEACVCHLTAALHQRQPYISQQLALLREANLVIERREGTLVYYRLSNPQVVEMIALGKKWIRNAEGKAVTFPTAPEGQVAGCPCPRCQSE